MVDTFNSDFADAVSDGSESQATNILLLVHTYKNSSDNFFKRISDAKNDRLKTKNTPLKVKEIEMIIKE